MKTFKAYLVEEHTEEFVGSVSERKQSDLPDYDVLIKVFYSSLNYKDALSAKGNKGVTKNYPHTPGIDAAGIVKESRDPNFKAGDEVIVIGYDLGMNTPGGYGQYISVPGNWIVRKPAGLTLKESMIYGTAGLTAVMSLEKLEHNGLKPGQGKVLVTGATGGVGSLAVALLSQLGYDVTAVTGKLDESPYLKELGATEILDRNEFAKVTKYPMAKEIWAGVLDTVGGKILMNALKGLKAEGSASCCGMVSDSYFESSIFPFILRGVNLLGINSVDFDIERKRELWNKMGGSWKLHNMDRLVKRVVGLQELAEEIDCIYNGKMKGRVIVDLFK